MQATAVLTESERPSSASAPCVVVAIPVQNEQDRIGECLMALAAQKGLLTGQFGIVLLLNNCTDGTQAAIEAADMPWPMRVLVRNDPRATAGWARRLAMDAASEWLGEDPATDGVILTTDADSRVEADWVTRNLAAIAAGADLVAGRISLDPNEAALLPERLHARGRLESRYEVLLIEIEARLDPDLGNPWPCHWSKSGATLAVRDTVYRGVGGMPDMASGEDRAFVDAVRAFDLVVRHDSDISVVTSGRLDGRASGGVADTIRLRCDKPESRCDDRLEKLHRLVARTLLRRRLRTLHQQGRRDATRRWAILLAIPKPIAKRIAAAAWFGQAHAWIEMESPRLSYRPVRPKDLPRQTALATIIVRLLRLADTRRRRRATLEPPHVTKRTLPSLP